MCTLIYCYRPLKEKDKRSRGSLCFRFVYKRKAITISTGFILYSEEWDFAKQQVVPQTSLTNRSAYLQSAEEKMNEVYLLYQEIVNHLEEQGGYTVYDVARIYRCHSDPRNLSGYCQRQESLLIKAGQQRTARAYRSAVRSLLTFNQGKEIGLHEITPSLLKEYERYLKERGKSLNTISFYMRNLRSLYNKSLDENIVLVKQKKPFSAVYTGISRTKKRALSLEEVIKLQDFDISKYPEPKFIQLSRCRRFFFFSFYARGMSFVDMAYLRKENIRKGVISYYRKKTGQLINVTLTHELKDIIESFARETKFSSYVFPIIKEKEKDLRLQYENGLRNYNKELKELGTLCSLKKVLSSHVARHSWATIAKHECLPLSIISEGLGHSNEKTTYIYLASFERSFLDEANERIGCAIKRGKCNSPQRASTL